VILLPEAAAPPTVPLRRQLSEVANRRVVLALMTTMIGFAGQIVAYTYLTPFLEHVSGFRPDSISALLVAFGVAAAVGTFIAGPAIDRHPRTLPALGLATLAAVLALMTLTGETRLEAALTLIAWGATSFGIGPILQQQAAHAAPHSADIVSSLNISAFNLGIAVGAALGGRVVASSGVHAVTWVGAIVVSISVALASINALGTRCT
jgi:DHA1 family inner membrane transport protein